MPFWTKDLCIVGVKLENDRKQKKKSSSGKRPGSQKRKKTADLVIHKEIPVPPESIPTGSIFKGCRPYTVQGIRILPYNVCYLLERWLTPADKNIVGKLPSHIQAHYDFQLKSYVLYQYNQCHVTQPLILEQLWEWGMDISAGQLSRILTEDKDIFHNEKDELLLVLQRPEIPLHNNLSENDIREYVKRRKISGSTRSELGRHLRDTFTSLKKTCRKLGVSFWDYPIDRLSGVNKIPSVQELIA